MRSRVASALASTRRRAQRLAEHERAEARPAHDAARARRASRSARTRRTRSRGAAVLREVEEEVVREPQRVEARAARRAARSAAIVSNRSGDSPGTEKSYCGSASPMRTMREPSRSHADPSPSACRHPARILRRARVRAERVGGAGRATCSTSSRAACGAVAARRARRRRPPPVGVHARRPGRRATRPPRRGRSPVPRSSASTCAPTTASTRASACSTSCRSSRSTSRRPAARRGRARRSRAWIGDELGVPVFLYDDADPAAARCPTRAATRSSTRAPDLGPGVAAPAARRDRGRRPAAARRGELRARPRRPRARPARSPREVRERDGGLPGVRALGLPARVGGGAAQVSMNLVDLARDGLEAACTEVRAPGRGAPARAVDAGRAGRAGARRRAGALRPPTFRDWAGLGRRRRRSRRGSAAPAAAERRRRSRGVRRMAMPRRSRARWRRTRRRSRSDRPPQMPNFSPCCERVLEALDPDLAAPADRLRLPGRGPALGEEQIGVDPEAVGALLPAPLTPRPGQDGSQSDELLELHRHLPSANDADGITSVLLCRSDTLAAVTQAGSSLFCARFPDRFCPVSRADSGRNPDQRDLRSWGRDRSRRRAPSRRSAATSRARPPTPS